MKLSWQVHVYTGVFKIIFQNRNFFACIDNKLFLVETQTAASPTPTQDDLTLPPDVVRVASMEEIAEESAEDLVRLESSE